MKRVVLAAVVATAVASGGLLFAEAARLRHHASVYADGNGVGFKSPEGVACDAAGQFVVGDTGNDRLLRFTFRDKTVAGGTEIKLPELSAPTVVHLTPGGEILALDGKRRRIVRIGADGGFKGPLAFEGVPPPTTIVVKSFKVDAAGSVYVLDAFSGRVLVLAPDGKFQRAVVLPADAGFPTDLAVDVSGSILVLDSITRRIYAVARDASAFAQIGGDLREAVNTLPTYLAATKGTILVVEGTGSSIVSLGRDGTFLSRALQEGWKDGSLNHPAQICINENDEVFVADRDNSRVQVFGLLR
jgi:hypothetical protein